MPLRTGAGGYGGMTTLSTDQRQSPYHPHKTLLKYKNFKLNKMVIKCIDCHSEWEHEIGDPWKSAPEVCGEEKET